MDIVIRRATDNDAGAFGRVCYEGFRTVCERYGFPLTFPSVEVARQRVSSFIRHPSVFGVVAEAGDGWIVGFNFLSERDPMRPRAPTSGNKRLQEQARDRCPKLGQSDSYVDFLHSGITLPPTFSRYR